jgi:hypothetical protein
MYSVYETVNILYDAAAIARGGNNYSPTHQMQVEFGFGEYFFFKLTRFFFLLSVSLFSPLIDQSCKKIMCEGW